jgi:Na+/H+ antiporter NhaD/arsenite permease-like protein
MSDATLSLVILSVAVVLFIWNRLPVEAVAIGVALMLYFTGLVDTRTLFSGFGDAVIVFIAALFVVSEGLEESGVTAWVSGTLARFAGRTYTRLLVAVMALGALLSAVITVNGAAAALVPVTVAVARRARILPSRVLIPLAYGCSAGALLTLGGSPVNVIVHDASRDNGGPGFGISSLRSSASHWCWRRSRRLRSSRADCSRSGRRRHCRPTSVTICRASSSIGGWPADCFG